MTAKLSMLRSCDRRKCRSDLSNLKGFFEYFDEDVMLWKKRYSWELVEKQRGRQYLSDISVFVEFINRVMRDIER